MKKRKQEFLTNRFKAISKVSFLLDTVESERWDFTSVCRMFVETVGYLSCWTALVYESGEIKNYSMYRKEELFNSSFKMTETDIADFVKEALVHSSDYLINSDPMLDYLVNGIAVESGVHSITFKLSYNNMIYGVLSILMSGEYEAVREEVLILTDAVKTISFFLYDIDVRDKVKDIFLTMFETTGNGTALFEEDTTISYVNREFELLSGYSKEEIEGNISWTEFIYSEDLERMLEYHRQRRINPQSAPRNYEFRFIDRHSTIKNIYMTIDMVPRTKVSIASFMNITEKKRLESDILRISEQERQQIGNDLHDGLSPHLVGIQFMLKVIKGRIKGGDMPSVEEIDEIDRLISDAISKTRTLIKGLKPVDIQPDGLLFALEELVNKTCSMYGLDCHLDCDSAISINNNITATHLFYIVQEAINNTVKHARAHRIEVKVKKLDRGLFVEIKDDGIGIPSMIDPAKGMGVSIMKYRASIINGDLTISRLPSGGTLIQCTLFT